MLWLAIVMTSEVASAGDDDLPWLEYRPAVGCPGRDALRQELLRRWSHRAPASNAVLQIHVEYSDGTYVGTVKHGDTQAEAARRVHNDSCEQLIHALALSAALMLDGDTQPAPESAENQPPDATPAAAAPTLTATSAPPSPESSVVSAPRQQNPAPASKRARPIHSFTFGPFIAATSDGLATPDWFALGGRVGTVLTFHGVWGSSQQVLRVSAARVNRGTTQVDGAESSTAWSSVRLDVCHGATAHELRFIGVCALFDVGGFSGTRRVDQANYSNTAYLARAGAGLLLRQPILRGLSLHADLGAMLPFTHPSFYVPRRGNNAERALAEVRTVGPVADLGIELHFW
jgi:hypothetical protein